MDGDLAIDELSLSEENAERCTATRSLLNPRSSSVKLCESGDEGKTDPNAGSMLNVLLPMLEGLKHARSQMVRQPWSGILHGEHDAVRAFEPGFHPYRGS